MVNHGRHERGRVCESAEFIHQARLTSCAEVDLANKQRFISLDLLFGIPSCDEIMMYLLDNGLTRSEHAWFMRNSRRPPGTGPGLLRS
jgi:hypothetical protein